MMSMKWSLLFLVFCYCGCDQPQNRGIIAPGKGKYWDVLKTGGRRFSIPAYCYYFGCQGNCYYLNYYRKEGGKVGRTLFDFGDVVYPETWTLNADTMVIQGFRYLVKDIDANEIVLINAGSEDTLMLGAAVYGQIYSR